VTGITATFAGAATASVSIGGSSTATVNVATGTAPGTYELNITGTDTGGNTSVATILVTVQTGGFTLSPAEDYLSMPAGSAPQTDVVTVAPISTFSGLVNLSVQSITNGLGTPVTGGVTASFLAPSSVTLPATTMDTLTINVGDAPADDYTINLTGTDSTGSTATAQVDVDVTAGFTVAATPQALTVAPGGSTTSSISVLAAGSESGPVSLFAHIFGFDGEVEDGSVSVSFSPQSLTIGGSTPSIAKVSVGSSVATGSTYTVWVYGQDAGGTKSGTPISLTLGTPTLKIKTNPTASVVAGGASVTPTVIVTPGGGLQGNVTLSVSIVPSAGGTAPTGLTVTFSPSSATIDPNDDSITSVATIAATSSVPAGTYTATVTATDGSLSAVTTVTITVSTYSLTFNDNGWSPDGNSLSTGQVTTDAITATIQPNLPSGASVTYSWSANDAWFSLDNGDANPYMLDSVSDYYLSWPSGSLSSNPLNPVTTDNTGTANTDTLSGIFNTVGFYIVQISCTATIAVPGGPTITLTTPYYLGGTPNSIATQPSSASSSSVNEVAENVTPMNAPTNKIANPTAGGSSSNKVIIFVHGVRQGFDADGLTVWGGSDLGYMWQPNMIKAICSSFGIAKLSLGDSFNTETNCECYEWSGNIPWRADAGYEKSPNDDLIGLIDKIHGYAEEGKTVILVGYSAGGALSVATYSYLQQNPSSYNTAIQQRIKCIVRLDSPPVSNDFYVKPGSLAIFNAMDEYDLCVQDYAWWQVPIDGYLWGGYGDGYTHPAVFPNDENVTRDPNGFTAMRVTAMSGTTPLDSAYRGASFPYLTYGQLLKDIKHKNTGRRDVYRLESAVAIHLAIWADSSGAWSQVNTKWGSQFLAIK
jgi:pimeloyl-ACP methyl ester carboxylesterase